MSGVLKLTCGTVIVVLLVNLVSWSQAVQALSPGCTTMRGDNLKHGKTKVYKEPMACLRCVCPTWNNNVMCYYVDCIPAMCVNPSEALSDCCETCPDGDNCEIPETGEVINAGAPVEKNGMICRCPRKVFGQLIPRQRKHYTAICDPA